MDWRNRIVGHGDADPEDLLANPGNWRIHPSAQQDALLAVLDEVGLVQTIVVNQRTGFVVDGHLRIQLALRHEQATVPVTYVDLSAAEERIVMAALDATSHMGAPDEEKLGELLAAIAAEEPHLSELVAAIAAEYEVVPEAEPEPRDPKTITCPACGHEFEL